MKKLGIISIGAALLAAAAIPGLAAAQETPWSVRLGVTQLEPANKSDPFKDTLTFSADAISVSKKTLPEFDVYYSFNPNLVAELVLTIPQQHTVNLAGVGDLGTFKQLPPTLLAQWHFMPAQQFDPYIGAGVNFTWISSVHLNVAPLNQNLDLKKSSWGLALEAGVDFNVDKRWYVNANIKYVNPLQTDVTLNGAKVTTVKVDPYLYSLGVGYHF